MKISLRWLRDYAPLDAPLSQVVRALVDAGIEVGEVSDEAAGIVVARVDALEPVPGSEHLLFADLDIGLLVPPSLQQLGIATTPLRVVTGAANLHIGDLVPYAPPGCRPPALDEPLGVRSFRGGHRSPGMLCSAAELGAGDDASGILVLERGTPGQPLREALDTDTVLDLEVTPNRPDCMCHLGVARELAAALHESLNEPPLEVPEERLSAGAVATRAQVQVDDPEGCPRFCVRVIEGVHVEASPPWLQRRLRAVGLRPINNVVDVTNYVARELGQPLHAFDLDRFCELAGGAGRQAAVRVRRARDGERLLCLDGVERVLAPGDLAVCAGDTVASLAGLIGGEPTAVHSDTPAILLEAASWDGPTIRASSRRLGLRTDASTLFEKGLSDTLPPRALDRAAALIAGLAGGHVLGGTVDAWVRPLPAIAAIAITGQRISELLGMPVDASEAATVLAHLGFAVEQDGDALRVLPPHFRRDVSIAEDVVEEVGRALGYERLPRTLPGRRSAVTHLAPPPQLEDEVRDVCLGAGFDEAITFAFTTPAAAAILPGAGRGHRPIPLRNPLSEEWSVLRVSQLPGICAALAANLHRGVEEPWLFEVGRVFWDGARTEPVPGATPDGADSALPPLPLEPLLLSLAACSEGDAGAAATCLRHLQATVERVLADTGGAPVRVEPAAVEGLRPGRSARLLTGDQPVGVLGELSAAAADALELRGRVAVAELQLEALLPSPPRPPRFLAPPRLPAVVRDLALSVPEKHPAGAALRIVAAAAGPLLEGVELYDEFRGGSLGAGRKGWTFRLTLRAPDRTLTGEEAQAVLDQVGAALGRELAAEVRR